MFSTLYNTVTQTQPFKTLQQLLNHLHPSQPVVISNVRGSLLAFLSVFIYNTIKRTTIVLTPTGDQAETLRDDCASLYRSSSIQLFAFSSHHHSLQIDLTHSTASLETLVALTRNTSSIVTAAVGSVARSIPSPDVLRQQIVELEAGKEYPFTQLLELLAEWGFVKKDFVEEYGDYAVRGGIVDVYPYTGDNPLRIDFWGDTIESIREFDVQSQRSINERTSALLVGYNLEQEIATSATASLFDYLPSNAIILIEEPVLCQRELEELVKEGCTLQFDWTDIEKKVSQLARVVHSTFQTSSSVQVDFASLPHPPINASIKRLIEHLHVYSQKNLNVVLLCDTQQEATRLSELIEEELTAPERETSDNRSNNPLQYTILPTALHKGFVYPAANIAVLTEHEIFERLKKRGISRRRFKGITQKELFQLRRGDYVVHQDYGIGKFAGLNKIKINGVETEVMKLVYEGGDTLYVNLNFINRIQKYSSQEGVTPKLSKLGTPDWERLKARAHKKVKDIARDLITLYARRKMEQGFACAPDTHWQKELEASFLYEDTPDQARTTLEVKRDMESSSPMDRLVCGDVGFGKTEIAVRAAFKAVMNGKQVAVLVPTTILAQQHYFTFRDRVERYSVRVEMLNRFKTKKEQQQIIQQLQQGNIDIIIGTHRLLSKDVQFKDLGLLIIDEEHRFGVAAKEQLRQLRATIDTLTLTATPIPRTLQFSLLGARDLSLITTPPRNRLPVHTEIAQYDKQLIREAIVRELQRGGQVFFVHDRIQDIDIVQRNLEELVPNARFKVAHGQMKGHDLEKTMMEFLEKRFDVLICTKIIESGIDIPNVNTMIINRADRFGLAELYQLRGRVGRSNVQAYTYLLTPPFSVLPRQTLRKLQALEEFTELGSGFNLALRDLEIRGAGNLLGAEQTGFIAEMGFEMYQRIVEEAVRELREQEFSDIFKGTQQTKQQPETVIEVDCGAYIPDIYIEHDGERFDIYRRLYRATAKQELTNIRDELIDRFGDYPEEVEHLLLVVEIRQKASQCGFTKVNINGNILLLTFPPSENVHFYEGDNAPFQHIIQQVQALENYRCSLKQQNTQLLLQITLTDTTNPMEKMKEVLTIVDYLLQHRTLQPL